MDKPTIQAAVWHAANQLFADGIRPTVANIREITKRGSAGTINEALKDWWHDLSRRVATTERCPEVPEPVAEVMRHLWTTSLERAEQALLAHREDADQQVKQAKELLAASETRNEQVERQSRMLEKQVSALNLSNAELQRALAAETALRKEAESRIELSREEAAKSSANMYASIARMEKQAELEKERYRSMERNLVAQVEEHKVMRKQAENRLGDLQAICSAREASHRATLLECKESSARQAERCALLDQRTTVLEHELKQAAERIQSLLHENAMLNRLSPQTLFTARTSPRLKPVRVKKRRL